MATEKSWMPTRKWWAALVTALAAWIVNWINEGELSKAILIALVGVVAQAAVAYIVPNADTPGGVPTKQV
jgi:hypothetical protein